MNSQTLDLPTLESWRWDAACSIRGAIDAPRYKEYILPLLFCKRLPDVYAADLARELAAQHLDLTRVTIPGAHTWDAVRRDPTGLGNLGLHAPEPDI